MNLKQQQPKAKSQLPPYASSTAQTVKSLLTFHSERRFGISRKSKRCKVEMKSFNPFRA